MTSSNSQFHLRAAALGALALVGAAAAAAMWRGVDQQARQEAARQAELREFHDGLLDRVESLAENSGMLNSADLCLVRFRLRAETAHGVTSSAYAVRAQLTHPEPQTLLTPVGGKIEFGLMPPGRYQVEFVGPESYALRHDLNVLPGVPVDRLLLCPQESPYGLCIRVEIEWPESASTRNIIAVCEVERDDATFGQWTWQPADQTCVRVVEDSHQDLLTEDARQCIFQDAVDDGVEIVAGAPFRYCRIRAVNLYRRAAPGAPNWVRYARCVFGETANDVDSEGMRAQTEPLMASCRTVACGSPAPSYHWPSGQLNACWQLTPPEELAAEWLHAEDDSPAARASPDNCSQKETDRSRRNWSMTAVPRVEIAR